MNTHNPHNVCIFVQYIGLAVIHFIFFQLFNVSDKVKEPLEACPFKLRRFFQQHFHVGSAPCSARHCRHIFQISAGRENVLQKFMHRQINRMLTPVCEHFQEIPDLALQHCIPGFLRFFLFLLRLLILLLRFRFLLHKCCQDIIEPAIRRLCCFFCALRLDHRKFFIGKIPDTGMHHADQRNILKGIVQYR